MGVIQMKQLLEAGVHFGHQTRRWNPKMAEYIFTERNGIYIIDLQKTAKKIEEAYYFFENHSKIANRFKVLIDVGLGYVKVGQNALTLSGGEAQRVKLAYELQKKATGKTLFVLDEPTTGLHTDDVRKLIDVINRIVNNGDSVVMIEHNLDMIKVYIATGLNGKLTAELLYSLGYLSLN